MRAEVALSRNQEYVLYDVHRSSIYHPLGDILFDENSVCHSLKKVDIIRSFVLFSVHCIVAARQVAS